MVRMRNFVRHSGKFCDFTIALLVYKFLLRFNFLLFAISYIYYELDIRQLCANLKKIRNYINDSWKNEKNQQIFALFYHFLKSQFIFLPI